MALLIDIGDLSDEQTDRALNTIYKAIHNHDDDSIWRQHESVFIRRLVELFTQRGLMRLEGFRKELEQWLDGARHIGGTRIERPAGYMQRWTPMELSFVRTYLEALPRDAFTLDDWMMVIDYLAQRYLPAEDLRKESDWLAIRSTMMGAVQANIEAVTERDADRVLVAMPNTAEEAGAAMNRTQRVVLEYARARGAENVQRIADNTRHRMRNLIIEHTEREAFGGPRVSSSSLQTELADEFATLNRDWRRIAVTEAGENANQGMIASLKPGSRVKRMEYYESACGWCRKIDGMVMRVVSPDDPDKNGDTDVWVGKTNIGRSAAPRKRVGSLLVHREPEELYWVAAGTQHPHCRGWWQALPDAHPDDDPVFAEWLNNLFKGQE